MSGPPAADVAWSEGSSGAPEADGSLAGVGRLRGGLLSRLGLGAPVRHFAGLVSPAGLHMAEYRHARGGVEVVQYQFQGAAGDRTEAPARVAGVAEAMGGRRGRLSLAVSGFGSTHHILALPPADREILRPIVEREMRRFYPDVEDPYIEFITSGSAVEGDTLRQELLVGAVPRSLASAFRERLAARAIDLENLTIFPRVVQALHDQLIGVSDPAVVLILMESESLVGCFHEGQLRLFSEPQAQVRDEGGRDWGRAVEHVDRGRLFLRQQFDVEVDQVFLAAPRQEREAVVSLLRETLEVAVHSFGPAGIPPGALAALGAALAAQGEGELNMLPPEMQPPSQGERWSRALGIAAGVVVALAAILWSWQGVALARTNAEGLEGARTQLEDRVGFVGSAQDVLFERAAHAERLAFLEASEEERAQVQRILAGFGGLVSGGAQLDRLSLTRAPDGWQVALSGTAVGETVAQTHRSIDRLYRGIPSRLPVQGPVDLGNLDTAPAVDGGGGAVAIAFEMSFIVSGEWNLQR